MNEAMNEIQEAVDVMQLLGKEISEGPESRFYPESEGTLRSICDDSDPPTLESVLAWIEEDIADFCGGQNCTDHDASAIAEKLELTLKAIVKRNETQTENTLIRLGRHQCLKSH